MATGLYNSKGVGASQVPQNSKLTPFGTVVSSGGVYNANGDLATFSPIGGSNSGWYTGNFDNNSSGGNSSVLGSGGGGAMGLSTYKTDKQKAEDAYKEALGLAQSGYNSALNFTNKHIPAADADLASARKAAGNISSAITNLNNTAISLTPFAQSLQGQGNSLLSLYDQLISGNVGAGGIVGDFLGSVQQAADAALNITPDRYVSQAASDVQSSFANAKGQMERDLSRRGVSAGSGAGMSALQKQLTQSLATALSAAKTKARQQGISDQLTALTQRAGLYKDVLNQAQSVQQQGTQNLAQAAGIVQAQGDMFSTAGNLGATQVNSFANIGGIEVNLGQLELQNNEAVQKALQGVVAAQQAMAEFYADFAPTSQTTSTTNRDAYGNYTYSDSTVKSQKG